MHPDTWSLDAALALIRALQPSCHAQFYHVTLGGGVLNKGYSAKDLDLYFLPFSDTQTTSLLNLLVLLDTTLGDRFNLGGPSVRPWDVDCAYPPQTKAFPGGRFTYRMADGKRIDVFIG